MPDMIQYAYIGIVGISIILFAFFLRKKYKKKSISIISEPDEKNIIASRGVKPQYDYSDLYEETPEPPEKVVIVRQKKSIKPIVEELTIGEELVIGEELIAEPEHKPDPDALIYACENCPSGRYHKRDMIFQCPDCGLWFCDKHISGHIFKKHRSKDYVVRSDENFVASYTKGR